MYHPLLESIFNAYEDNFIDDPDYCIRFYEGNSYNFDAVDVFDGEYLYKYEMITARYITALVQNRQYKKAVTESEKIVAIINSNATRLCIEHAMDSPYNGIIYQRAIAKYNSYVFKSALQDFEFLLRLDPENEHLQRWRIASKYYYYEYCFMGLAFALFACNWFLEHHVHRFVNIGILVAGFICCGIAIRYSIITRRRLKKAEEPE
ncbi:MAG: hypothetical protein ABIN91_12840 [Mucilaginibacter sp.]|uniref:hypothetical protein n=1 Tax=Mucilaginibacter sp. TaxID=1882438 RepID=UPI0032634927